MTKYITVAISLIMLLLSSCATLLDVKRQKTKGIFITSNTLNAKVLIAKISLLVQHLYFLIQVKTQAYKP